MRNTIAVMNTKGGVGKSTLVLALAETLSAEHNKNVLVIDSDAQATVSNMLMTVNDLYRLQRDGLTIVDFLVTQVLREEEAKWSDFVIRDVSDIDYARSVYLMPSDMSVKSPRKALTVGCAIRSPTFSMRCAVSLTSS